MLGAILGGLAGGILPALGAQQTNASNESIANNANVFNADQARQNREFQAAQVSAQQAFQERMANTAHQREMEDMKAAGINPMLSAKGVGANSPSGASASGAQATANTARMENPYAGFAGVASTAMDITSMAAQLKKQAAETDFIRTQNEVAKKNIPKAEITNEAYNWVKKKVQELNQFNSQRNNPEKHIKGYNKDTKMFEFGKP